MLGQDCTWALAGGWDYGRQSLSATQDAKVSGGLCCHGRAPAVRGWGPPHCSVGPATGTPSFHLHSPLEAETSPSFLLLVKALSRDLGISQDHLHLCYTCGPCSTCRTPLRGDNPPDIREFHQIAHHPLPPPRAPGMLRITVEHPAAAQHTALGAGHVPYPLSHLCCSHVPSRLWSLSHAVALTLADFLESSDVLTCLLFWS